MTYPFNPPPITPELDDFALLDAQVFFVQSEASTMRQRVRDTITAYLYAAAVDAATDGIYPSLTETRAAVERVRAAGTQAVHDA